jgi:type IV pilus assembly protein PilB
MSPTQHKKLGELLIEAHIIDESQLKAALSNQRSYGGRLGTILVKMGFLKEIDMLKFLSKQLNLPMVDLHKIVVEQKIIDLIPIDVAEKYNILPLAIKVISGKPLLHIAMSDPTNLGAIDTIQFTAGYKIQPVLALDSSLTDFINFYYKGKEVSRQTMDIPVTQRDEELYVELQQIEPHNITAETEPQQQKQEAKDDKLLPFIKALIAILVKKGVCTPEEFKEALANEYKNKP